MGLNGQRKETAAVAVFALVSLLLLGLVGFAYLVYPTPYHSWSRNGEQYRAPRWDSDHPQVFHGSDGWVPVPVN